MARRRLRAVDAAAPLHDVEIELENPPLAELALELKGDDHLANFPQRILRRVEIEIARELHCDRAAAARELALLPVALRRLLELIEVDAVVAEERRVLAQEDRFFEMFRYRIIRHPD